MYNFFDVNNVNMNFVNVVNNLVIEYEVFVVLVDGLIDGVMYWVSVGIEYNNSYNVWIG